MNGLSRRQVSTATKRPACGTVWDQHAGMSDQVSSETSAADMGKASAQRCHRLHYAWPQLEADKCGVNIGSSQNPLPKPDRVVRLQPGKRYDEWPIPDEDLPVEDTHFAKHVDVYKTNWYNTFCKNGALKLTEIELYFMSQFMTRTSCSEWALVYLGMGHGDRFRCMRDDYFPGLTVLGFDPIDESFQKFRSYAKENAKIWNDDGTNFYLHIKCFEEDDAVWVTEKVKGKRLLLISDIRGVAKQGQRFDKDYDNDLQWSAIQGLRPVSSLLKFVVPHAFEQFYDYPPGVLLKQVFCNFGTAELRLMVEGVPEKMYRYNAWELYEQMARHHDYLRGQVYQTLKPCDVACCLDSCFDCALLMDTFTNYAEQNSMDANKLLQHALKHHIYTPGLVGAFGTNYQDYGVAPLNNAQQWEDVEWSLQKGKLTEAIAALEANSESSGATADWYNMACGLDESQPDLANRIRSSLKRPASREDLIMLLGRLADPFTLLKTDLNGLALS